MKKYIDPEMIVEEIIVEDVITTSSVEEPVDPDQGEII